MKSDEFEQQLERQPRRPLPPAWREEILEAARAALPHASASVSAEGARVSWWHEWLWPCPQAWAGLAAVWMVLLGLWLTGPFGGTTRVVSPPDPALRMALSAQRRELDQLLDVPSEPPRARKPVAPGPRSERGTPAKV